MTSPVPSRRTIRTVYQPIVDLRDGTLVAVEALSRGEPGPQESPQALFASARASGTLIELDEGADRIEFGGTICIGIADAGATVSREPGIVEVRDPHLSATRKGTYKGNVIEEDYHLNLPTGTVDAAEYHDFVGRVHVVDDGFMAGIRVKK